ncbi:MAG: hypothetical protein GF399_06590 [Candidatus Coatesbacteria bacterium]|nr:hypothetical protein [Candidatus Coatesbacteria bacterium]
MDNDKRMEMIKDDFKVLAVVLQRAGRASIWDEAKYHLREAAEVVARLSAKI